MFRQFDPPYESRLEENFAWDLTKYLSEAAVLRKQVEAVTPFATFRLDFVAETRGGSRVAFECDGKEFHPDGMRDQGTDSVSRVHKARSSIVCHSLLSRLDGGGSFFAASLGSMRCVSSSGSRAVSDLASSARIPARSP